LHLQEATRIPRGLEEEETKGGKTPPDQTKETERDTYNRRDITREEHT
jgi:hypothetical protein